jgi:NADPH:quinone reductase-like Zn-dependent oxidoreductase
MKALCVSGPDVMPAAEPGTVVVDVIAASVDDCDKGRGFVGRVTAVGAGVDHIKVGMLVAGVSVPQYPEQPGAISKRVAVPADSVAPVPDGVDVVQAAGVGLSGITALCALDALGASHLGNLLIHGPVDGVGGFALQLAKARGAIVAVVTPRVDAELARGLGADRVIPEDGDPMGAVQKARFFLDGRVDSGLDVTGDPTVVAGVVRPGGRFTSTTGAASQMTRADIEYRPTVVAPSGHQLADLLFKVASRRLICRVQRTDGVV